MITLNFLITSLIVVLIPGPGVVYTVSTGLTLGKRVLTHVGRPSGSPVLLADSVRWEAVYPF